MPKNKQTKWYQANDQSVELRAQTKLEQPRRPPSFSLGNRGCPIYGIKFKQGYKLTALYAQRNVC